MPLSSNENTDRLYGRYVVERNGAGVDDCFVLEYASDPHARAALRAYAESCREEKPGLAADLFRRLLAMGEGRYVSAAERASANARYKL